MNWYDGIPWVIAVIGWGATHVFSEARERRKDNKAQIDKTLERLASIEKDALSFHSHTDYDALKARNISASLDRLERSIDRNPVLSIDAFVPKIVHLRRAITLRNFDKSEFTQQDPYSELLAEICSEVADMEDEIDRQYNRAYPSTFPYFKLKRLKSPQRLEE